LGGEGKGYGDGVLPKIPLTVHNQENGWFLHSYIAKKTRKPGKKFASKSGG